MQPIMAEWNRYQYQLRQFTQVLKPTNFNNVAPTVEKTEPTVEKTEPTVEKTEPTVEKTEPTVEKTGEASMKEWKRTFVFNKQEFYYNRIRFNNPTERAVEIPIAFNFLAALNKPASVLEVGNVLSHYENHLSERLGITSRRIVDKFEVEVGVDNEDLMNLPSDQKYDAIVSLSTVEHIGQKGDPSGGYGEQEENRDLEGPLKAIAKIYDLLAPDGKALITVPFGKLIDGEWYIQFSKEYLYLLGKKYGIPKEAVSVNCLKLIDRETNGSSFNVLWEELDALELSYVEYGSPFSQANAIAVIELSKLSSDFHLKLNVEPSPLLYNMSYETRTEFEQNKALLQQSQSELAEFQRQLQLTQSELEQCQAIQQQTQSELEQSQLQLHQTQSELEQCQAIQQQTQSELQQSQLQLHQTQSEWEQSQAIQQQTQSELEQSQAIQHLIQSELEQSQAIQYQTQSELEQSQSLLYQTQNELEQSQSLLYQTQSELEQSQSLLYQTQSELEQSQLQLHQTQSELEQSQLQLHQTQSELERLKFSQAMVRETEVKSQTQYKLLLWDGWYAYCKGDMNGMANFLK
jgi:SAM-dependent methyltransferase